MKKKVTAPLSYDPGKGRPKEHLAYLNWQEMQQLQRLNGGNMERGPRGLPSFPPADAKGSSSKSTSSSSRGPGGGSLSAPARTAPSSGRPSSGSYGGGGRDTGGKGNVGMGKAPSSGKAASESRGGGPSSRQGRSVAVSPSRSIGGGPASRQGRSVAIAPSAAGVRSIGSAVKPSRTSVYSSMNLRGPLGPDGSPIPQVTTYATNFQTAQMMRSMYPDVAKKYTQGQIVGALEKISSALPGEADVAKYGPGPMTDLGRVSLNQIVGGFSPKEAVAALDTTGIRKKTKGLEVPGPNSLGMTENWKDKQSGLSYKNMAARSIQDALLQRNVSPEAMNASNFVAAGSKPVPGTKKIGDPVRGTQFLHDPNWGNRIASRNLSASGILGQTDQTIAQGATPSRRSVGSAAPIPQIKPFNDPSRFKLKDPNILDNVNPVALTKLIRLQEQYGAPLTITSGHRNPLLNKQVGGVKGSQHIPGNAIDIKTPGASAEDTARLIREASSVGFTGIGGYRSGAIHVDVGNKRVWSPDSAPKTIKEALRDHASGAIPKSEINYAAMEGKPSIVPASGGAPASGFSRMSPAAQLAIKGALAAGKVLGSPGDYKLPSIPQAGDFQKKILASLPPDARQKVVNQKLGEMATEFGQKLPSYLSAGMDTVRRGIAGLGAGRQTVQQASNESFVDGGEPSVAPSQAGMTDEQQKEFDKYKKRVERTGQVAGVAGNLVFPGLGFGVRMAGKAINKAAEAKINKYVASTPAERAEQERKDPSLIGWARAIGVQPQNDYSVYQSWAQERGLRSPEESRGNQQDVQYAGGIGALPSASTPVGTSEQTGSRPYEYYQWDVGVNIPSPTDPNYTSYQEYLRRRAQAQA